MKDIKSYNYNRLKEDPFEKTRKIHKELICSIESVQQAFLKTVEEDKQVHTKYFNSFHNINVRISLLLTKQVGSKTWLKQFEIAKGFILKMQNYSKLKSMPYYSVLNPIVLLIVSLH